jgi:hypothetical protein
MDPTNLNRIEREKQGPPRLTTVMRLVRALDLPLDGGQSQELFRAARLTTATRIRETLLASPIRGRQKRADHAVLRELRKTLLQAVELVSELEENGQR